MSLDLMMQDIDSLITREGLFLSSENEKEPQILQKAKDSKIYKWNCFICGKKLNKNKHEYDLVSRLFTDNVTSGTTISLVTKKMSVILCLECCKYDDEMLTIFVSRLSDTLMMYKRVIEAALENIRDYVKKDAQTRLKLREDIQVLQKEFLEVKNNKSNDIKQKDLVIENLVSQIKKIEEERDNFKDLYLSVKKTGVNDGK